MHNPTIGIVIIRNTAQSSRYNIPIFVDTFVAVEKKLLCVRKITALFAVSCEVSEGLHPSVNTCNKALLLEDTALRLSFCLENHYFSRHYIILVQLQTILACFG